MCDHFVQGMKNIEFNPLKMLPYLIALIQLEGFEVLQFPQIPEFHTVVISSSGQVVTLEERCN